MWLRKWKLEEATINVPEVTLENSQQASPCSQLQTLPGGLDCENKDIVYGKALGGGGVIELRAQWHPLHKEGQARGRGG